MSSSKLVAKKSASKTPIKSSKKTEKKFCAKNLGECSICFEKLTLKTIVVCPSCPPDAPKTCKECTQENLLLNYTKTGPRCTIDSCKKEWPTSFFASTFPEEFRLGPYLEAKKKSIIEEQTAALPATLPLVESKKKEEALKEENEKLRLKLQKIEKKADLFYEQIQANKQTIKNGVAAGAQKIYMMKCPVVATTTENDDGSIEQEMCRGFIERDTYSCTLCKTEICNKCHVILEEPTGTKENPDILEKKHLGDLMKDAAKQRIDIVKKQWENKHKCKKEDVETAKTILLETKPCPKCSARIFKTSGCSQMYCTVPGCNIAFDWNTGLIETGTIHNPHYYELQRQLGRNQRAIGDVPCGGLVNYNQIYVLPFPEPQKTAITNIHRRCGEIGNYIRDLNREFAGNRGNEEIRINYLLGKLTQEEFENAVVERSSTIEKRREEVQILSTFETAVIERLRELVNQGNEINIRRILRADYEKEQRSKKTVGGEEIEYEKYTVVELKELLDERKLIKTGRKADLIKRLKDDDKKNGGKTKKKNSDDPIEVEEETDDEEPLQLGGGIVRAPPPTQPTKRKAHKRGRVRTAVKNAPVTSKSRTASVYMTLPKLDKEILLGKLCDVVIKEINEIVKFCNGAFQDNFTAMGYKEYPVMMLKEEYKFPKNAPGLYDPILVRGTIHRNTNEPQINRPRHRTHVLIGDNDIGDGIAAEIFALHGRAFHINE